MHFIVRWGVIKNKQKEKEKRKTITIKKMRVLRGGI